MLVLGEGRESGWGEGLCTKGATLDAVAQFTASLHHHQVLGEALGAVVQPARGDSPAGAGGGEGVSHPTALKASEGYREREGQVKLLTDTDHTVRPQSELLEVEGAGERTGDRVNLAGGEGPPEEVAVGGIRVSSGRAPVGGEGGQALNGDVLGAVVPAAKQPEGADPYVLCSPLDQCLGEELHLVVAEGARVLACPCVDLIQALGLAEVDPRRLRVLRVRDACLEHTPKGGVLCLLLAVAIIYIGREGKVVRRGVRTAANCVGHVVPLDCIVDDILQLENINLDYLWQGGGVYGIVEGVTRPVCGNKRVPHPSLPVVYREARAERRAPMRDDL